MREPLTTEQVLNIGEECLAGLATAHNHGVLHCELKPENLMITRDGLVKILAFGCARPDESEWTKDSVDLTCPGSLPTIGGTPAYMAPEVLLGTMPDRRSDIFSVGVVLYEAVAGFHPFREPNRGIADCILRNEPRRLPGPVPADLDLVLLRMLAKDPAQRYQSCADALADLRAVRANEKPALGQTRQTRRRRSLAKILPLVGAAILAVLLLSWPARPPARQVAASSRPFAVLPFQTASGDESSRAFARGLTETLTACKSPAALNATRCLERKHSQLPARRRHLASWRTRWPRKQQHGTDCRANQRENLCKRSTPTGLPGLTERRLFVRPNRPNVGQRVCTTLVTVCMCLCQHAE